MPAIPQNLTIVLHAYLAPLLALAVALAGALLCRNKARQGWLPAIGAASALIGWAALLPLPLAVRAAASPRNGPELLLVPAAAALAAGLAAPWLRGRLERWVPVALAVLTGWWLAASPIGRPEFWRVWAAIGVVAFALARGIGGEPGRGLAGGLALWGGLVLAGAPPGWIGAALVVAAGWAGLLAAGSGAALPAALMAGVIGGADLAAGRLIRGGLNAADLTCLAACAAPFLARPLEARLGKRLGRAGPVAAALIAAALAVGCAWLAQRVLKR